MRHTKKTRKAIALLDEYASAVRPYQYDIQKTIRCQFCGTAYRNIEDNCYCPCQFCKGSARIAKDQYDALDDLLQRATEAHDLVLLRKLATTLLSESYLSFEASMRVKYITKNFPNEVHDADA